MDFKTIKSVWRTRFFKTILILSGMYGAGFSLYLFIMDAYISVIFRDIIYTVYWR